MKKVDYENGLLKIKFYSNNKDEFYKMLEQVKSLYGRNFNIKSKVWTAPPTKSNIESLGRFGFDFNENCFQLFEKKEENYKEIELKRKLPEQMYSFQIDGVKFLESRNGNALIADSMGLGKTLQAIGYFIQHPDTFPVLIVCPASVKLNWRNEVIKWTKCQNKYIEILSGRTPLESLPFAHWYIINYDILQDWEEVIIKHKMQGIIIDECQYISNSKALRTKSFKNCLFSGSMLALSFCFEKFSVFHVVSHRQKRRIR